MAKRIKRTQIVDASSGEVLSEKRETSYQSDSYIPGKGYRLYSRKHTRIGSWNDVIDINAVGMLFKVIQAVDEHNRIDDVDKLAESSGLSKRRVYQLLTVLKKRGLVAKVAGGYALNPIIAFAGTYLSPTLYKLFEKDLLKIVPVWARAEYEREDDLHD